MREVWIQSYKVKQKTEKLPCSVARTCREDFDAEGKSTNLQRDVASRSQPERIRTREPQVSLLANSPQFPATHPAPGPSGRTNSSRRGGASRRRHTPPDPGCQSTQPIGTQL